MWKRNLRLQSSQAKKRQKKEHHQKRHLQSLHLQQRNKNIQKGRAQKENPLKERKRRKNRNHLNLCSKTYLTKREILQSDNLQLDLKTCLKSKTNYLSSRRKTSRSMLFVLEFPTVTERQSSTSTSVALGCRHLHPLATLRTARTLYHQSTSLI